MKIFFTEYLKVSLFTEEIFISINLENAYALKLFDSIFIKLYNHKIVIQSSELDSLVQDCIDNSKIKFYLICFSKISTELSDKLNELKNHPDNKELKKEILSSINLSSKIRFSKDLIHEDNIFLKEELNQIIDILFYIKDFGNVTPHPDINLYDSLKKLCIQSLPINFEIEYLYNKF